MPSSISDTKKPRRKSRMSETAETEDVSREERILATAIKLIAEKGFAAMRIDEVAVEASANKQLIYYYFNNKAGLYDAALARLVELTSPTWEEIEAAPTLRQAIERYRKRSELGVIWRRFLAWEGVEQAGRGGEIRLEDERTAAWRHLTKVVEKAQSSGELAPELDASMFALLITSFTSTALVLPQVATMITGADPDSEEFNSRQGALVEALLAALRGDAEQV